MVYRDVQGEKVISHYRYALDATDIRRQIEKLNKDLSKQLGKVNPLKWELAN